MKQEIFKFQPKLALLREDFFISASNRDALNVVDNLNTWQFFAYNIYGETGSGKTHLVHIFSKAYDSGIVSAHDIEMSNFYDYYENNKVLVIEDVDDTINQEAMFHLYNLYKNEGGFLLFTSQKPIAQLNFGIKDLQSRLIAVPSVEILAPDDDLLSALIIKLCDDRQLALGVDVLTYIIKHIDRSFSYIKVLIEELDSLSLMRQKPVNIAMVKEIIAFLSDNLQPSLF